MDIKKEPTGKDRGLEQLTNRFVPNKIRDEGFEVNSLRFLTRNGSPSHVSDFKFLDRALNYLECGAKYYVDVIAHARSADFTRDAIFYNVCLDVVAIRLLGKEEYRRIAAIVKYPLPSLYLPKSPPPPEGFLSQLEFGNLVEFSARITAGTPMFFEVSARGFKVLNDASLGGAR
jgi:hypothetical protein